MPMLQKKQISILKRRHQILEKEKEEFRVRSKIPGSRQPVVQRPLYRRLFSDPEFQTISEFEKRVQVFFEIPKMNSKQLWDSKKEFNRFFRIRNKN